VKPQNEAKQALMQTFRTRLALTREASTAEASDHRYYEGYGLLLAGLVLGVLESAEYNRLGDLIGDASHQRRVECCYHAPVFTGADRAKAYGVERQRAARAQP